MKPRSFHRLARMWSWLSARERRAWKRAVEESTYQESQRWFRISSRWLALCAAVKTCPRQEAA